MKDDNGARETAKRLRRLIDEARLSKTDSELAARCLRRLEQPLRVTVFGTDIGHAVSILNLMIGQSVISPEVKRARIQFAHDIVPHAKLLYRNGSEKRIDGANFRRLFDENPNRMRIFVDLPVLRKISIMVAADRNPKALCADAERTLKGSDISLWAGADLCDPMQAVWADLPQRLRDHSYLVPTPTMDISSWSSIENEFAGVLRVAPRRALKAKIGPDGPDKEAFRQVGGIDFVRTIKNEIDILLQSAVDTAEVLLMRHAREPEASATAGQEKTRGISPKTALELIAEMRPSQRFLTIAREHSSEPAAPTEKTIELHEEISPEDPADYVTPNEVDKKAPIEFPGHIDVPAAEPKDDIENRDEIEKTSVARGTADAAQFKTPIDGPDIADLIARVKNAP